VTGSVGYGCTANGYMKKERRIGWGRTKETHSRIRPSSGMLERLTVSSLRGDGRVEMDKGKAKKREMQSVGLILEFGPTSAQKGASPRWNFWIEKTGQRCS